MNVLYFGVARDCAGRSSEEIELEEGITTEELWNVLTARHPELAACRDISRIAVDMNYIEAGERISGAREIAIIPPVAGG